MKPYGNYDPKRQYRRGFHYEDLPDWCGNQCILFVEVDPPSAHERAEALLSLAEWLDDKVSEEEKRDLLQLTDEAEI